MYDYIKGYFISIEKEYVVVECGDIGYRIFTSGSTISNMPSNGEKVKLFIQQVVREDFLGLYGFLTREELEMFNLLISINGVGPKAALSLMSICNMINLRYAIITGDEKTITKAPGIGKKIAQRIILELKDKITAEGQWIQEGKIQVEKKHNEKLSEALGALMSLGYSEKEAEKAIEGIDHNSSIEDIIKNCLKNLMN